MNSHRHQPLPPGDYAPPPAAPARAPAHAPDPAPAAQEPVAPLDYASDPVARPLVAAPDCKWLGYSRTVWLNAAAAVLVFLEANTELLQPLLPVNFYAALAVLLPAANIALRVLTTQPLSLTPTRQAVTVTARNQPE